MILRVNVRNVVREVILAMDHALLLIHNVLLLIFLSAAKPAGVKSATTTTTATAPAQPHPSPAAAVVHSALSVACAVLLAL